MYPEQINKPFLTPKLLIICGILLIALTVGINYAYNAYVQAQVETIDPGSDQEPSGESIEIVQDTFTFEAEDQKYTIDYPKTVIVKELQKKYYKNSKRLLEGSTEFISNKKTSDSEYFKIIITTQRTYKDDEDKTELLTNILTSQRYCPSSEYKKIKEINQDINETKYTVRKNVRGCGVAYTTFFDSFTRVGTYVIQVQSTQPFEKVKAGVEEILSTIYLDSA
ncbi:MAG: hypothetical protein M3Q44_06815 [bacterium]|nr:hypothetical protein [bacterium]